MRTLMLISCLSLLWGCAAQTQTASIKPSKPEPAPKSLYEKEKEKLLLRLVQSPPVPLKEPDKVVMVYVLPWTDDKGNFHAGEYVFLVVEEGRWILEKGSAQKDKVRLLTPLEGKK